MSRTTAISANQGKLIDLLIKDYSLINDAGVARALKVAPPVISKIRNHKLPVGATMILAIHEKFGKPINDIRKAMAA
jgi:hypothetical protein